MVDFAGGIAADGGVDDFSLTPMEMIFLVVAILVTVPFVIFLRYILRELKKEQK